MPNWQQCNAITQWRSILDWSVWSVESVDDELLVVSIDFFGSMISPAVTGTKSLLFISILCVYHRNDKIWRKNKNNFISLSFDRRCYKVANLPVKWLEKPRPMQLQMTCTCNDHVRTMHSSGQRRKQHHKSSQPVKPHWIKHHIRTKIPSFCPLIYESNSWYFTRISDYIHFNSFF